MKQVRAIIADDEDALRAYLKDRLSALWPELTIIGEARDGETALRLIRDTRPDIAFLDIQMPGLSGIEVAKKAAGTCLFVFVTAYDRYAVDAFESEAIDYLLKPVTDERLTRTVQRLQERLASETVPDLSGLLERMSRSSASLSLPGHLQWIKAQHRESIRLIPVADIYYFKSTDKYTSLRTKDGEFLIRKAIKELEDELDPAQFWRVHRAAIVNVTAIQTVNRSLAGSFTITFKDIKDHVAVSRAYSHLFKQM
jgi:DNA-binding LytR/AlgR family response regulator